MKKCGFHRVVFQMSLVLVLCAIGTNADPSPNDSPLQKVSLKHAPSLRKAVSPATSKPLLDITVALPKNSTSATNATIDEAAAMKWEKNCQLGGIPIVEDYTYLTGEEEEEDMVYVVCDDKTGKPVCFTDLNIADRNMTKMPDPEVPCPITDAALAALTKWNEAVDTDSGAGSDGSDDSDDSGNDSLMNESRRKDRRRLGLIVSRRANIWPEGVVCYRYELRGSDDFQNLIMREWTVAMDKYRRGVGLQFMDRAECIRRFKDGGASTAVCNNCQRAVRIINQFDDDSYGTLGYSSWKDATVNVGDDIGIGNSAERDRAFVHELGHAIGLKHEHSHPNRPLIIVQSQLPRGTELHNFSIKRWWSHATEYDPNSIMHYFLRALCLPNRRDYPGTNFCDAHVNGFRAFITGCTVPQLEHCDSRPIGPRDIDRYLHPNAVSTLPTRPTAELSDGDVETLLSMYTMLAR